MNTLVIFVALLLAIIVFFLLYCLTYKKIKNGNLLNNDNKVVENFQCTSDPLNLFHIEIDNEIQACFNNVNSLYKNYLVGNEFTLYNFNGENSYAYVRDFLDNFFDFSLIVIFKNVNKTTPQTLIDTKYLKAELIGNELKLIYNHQDSNLDNQKQRIFPSIETNTVYQLKISQHFKFKDVYFSFDEYAKLDQIKEEIFDTAPQHNCRYSSGNDIYIGCNRSRTNYLNAYIGNLLFKFDKREFDKYDYPQISLPTDLECDASMDYSEPIVTTYSGPTQIVENPFNNLSDYLSINIGNQLNDLKIKYFYTEREDALEEISLDLITQINRYYSEMTEKNNIFTNEQTILLEKNNGMFDGYDNVRNIDDDNMYYLFSLQIEQNTNKLSKFSFLDLLFVKSIIDEYEESYIFIYGEKSPMKSYHEFLHIKKPMFFIVFKNKEDKFLQFEQININLNNFYEVQKKYLIYLAGTESKQNTIENFVGFIDDLHTHEAITNDQELTEDDLSKKEELTYIRNIFRLYESRIDFSSIDVNIYKDAVLEDVVYVKYKSEQGQDTCNFVPRGETKFECIQKCINDEYYSCREVDCKSLCNNCKTPECKWNILDIERQKMFVPNPIKVKGFAGDRKIKLTWIKPMSDYEIEKYFVIVENEVNMNRFDMYVYDGPEDMIEFVISDLENSLPHSFYVFSKNSQGVSDPSNRVTLIPQKNKLLDMENVSKNSFSDSLQNYYKNMESSTDDINQLNQLNNQIKNMDYLIETNRLKEILVDKIVGSKIGNVNINVF